ncbi:MAG: AAA family ATPase [Clostridiales bacterium]|nr:AAA family ATPase [Clostridiales bacterium]
MSEFDKIIGYKDIKSELIRLCDIIRNGEKYKALGVALSGGLLLDGDPGVGKTLMANCFIKESGRPAFVCRKNKPDGEFVNEIKKTFNEAVENAPSIILLDDMDKFANEDDNHKNAAEYVTVQSCIDEVKDKDIFVLATTNGTGNLPKSLLRAGRFDTIINVSVPEKQDAVEIVKHYLSAKKAIAEVNAEDVARLLSGKSCADLETVINTAGQYAGYANKEYIDMDDITRACLRVIYNAPESSAPGNPIVLERIAYHEAGHAVAAEILEEGSVDLVTVRKNTGKVGGLTCFHLADDYWISKTHMENRVIAILAGKAATEIVFGETDTGVNNDLQRAFDIVQRFTDAYCAYGFGHWTERNSSQTLITRKEEHIAADMERYYTQAKKILIKNRTFLDGIAKRLQEKDTLVYSEIKGIRAKTVGLPA